MSGIVSIVENILDRPGVALRGCAEHGYDGKHSRFDRAASYALRSDLPSLRGMADHGESIGVANLRSPHHTYDTHVGRAARVHLKTERWITVYEHT
jgi:hypothetical protein